MAARCADDYVRTIKFIRGLYDAIQDFRKIISSRPIRVLYVGCGPYATLAIPLMSILSESDVTFELLDIHQDSIANAKSILSALDFLQYVSNFEVIDAGSKKLNPEKPPDIIIMEIMNACLEKEPQVQITRLLLQQAPSAKIIPHSIKIDAYLVNRSKEFEFNASLSEQKALNRERIFIGTVFELSEKSVSLWKNDSNDHLPASLIKIPDRFESKFEAMLFTKINVYGNHLLKEYESGLTMPRTFPLIGSIKGGLCFKFQYRIGGHPGLTCDVHH